MDRSTAAHDAPPSASCSARKNPQRIPANTPPVFSSLRPRTWSHLMCLVTKTMSDRLLVWFIWCISLFEPGTPDNSKHHSRKSD